MKSIEVKGSLREAVGKTTSKTLRKEEQVPCVMYGQGNNVHFYIAEKAFKSLINTPNVYIVNIDVDGTSYQTILRDVQFHPVTDRVMHADFYQIVNDAPVWVKLPVILEGSSVGVLRGGKVVQKRRYLKVKGLPGDLPEDVKIDISKLDIGKTVKVADISIDKLELLDPASDVIVLVKTARGVKASDLAAAEEAEEAAE